MKLIIEGMDRDNTMRLSYVIDEAEIPENTSRIRIKFGDYKLDLVGKITNTGKLEKITAKEELETPLNYHLFGVPESPQIILVEDGRVYSWAKPKRLEAVIQDIHAGGGFDKVYEEIQKNPSRFYY